MSTESAKPITPPYAYTGEHCPVCNSIDIQGEAIEPEGCFAATRPVACDACGSNWMESLRVIGYIEGTITSPE